MRWVASGYRPQGSATVAGQLIMILWRDRHSIISHSRFLFILATLAGLYLRLLHHSIPTRPLFNFAFRRLSHRSFSSPDHQVDFDEEDIYNVDLRTIYYSGGHSGSVFYNDWIAIHKTRCLPPIDPSYAGALGPVQMVPLQTSLKTDSNYFNGTFSDWGDPYKVVCTVGHHFEPPLLDSQAAITCQSNGMWMDESALTIRRCVKDKLNCTWPLTDLGGLYCQPALPIIQELHASYRFNHSYLIVPSADAVTLIDVPLVGEVALSIMGSVFFDPVRVLVDGYSCVNPVLSNSVDSGVSTACYNESYGDANVHLVCVQYSRLITCTLPMTSLRVGRDMAVVVNSGRIDEVTEVDPSVGVVATLTSMAPTVTRIGVDNTDCGQVEQQPLSLFDCPITTTFPLIVCAASNSVGNGSSVLIMMDTPSGSLSLGCTAFTPDSEHPPVEMCTVCTVFPRRTSARLILRQPAIGMDSQQPVSISFRHCDAGFKTDYSGALLGNATGLCVACPLGSSTANVSSAYGLHTLRCRLLL